MSRRQWPWCCEACGAELGIVNHGELQGRSGLPYRVDTRGTLWIRCMALSDNGRLCGQERGWTATGRRSAPSAQVLDYQHAGHVPGRVHGGA